MIRKALMKITLLSLIIFLTSPGVFGQVANKQPEELQKIDVRENLGGSIPLDLEFVNHHGDSVQLAQYFNDGIPVILVLAYYECPMLCNLVMNGVSNSIRQLDWTPGEEYRILVISIDPEETVALAQGKRHRYVEDFGKPVAEDGWVFFVGEEKMSRELADSLGFIYYYDEKKDEYAHPAVVFLMTEEGKISRYLYGIEFKKQDLRLGLLEAGRGKIGNTLDKVLLYCYHYDPDEGSYTVFAENVMKLGGGITVVVLAFFMGGLWVRDRAKKAKQG
ncbi:MAG: SCO family protein [candidate division Zixibacteria bacterium]|nr:SCO family protein [candidate division Zixibacteria bacterium]